MLDIDQQTSNWSKIKYSETDLDQPFLKENYNALVLSSFNEMGISDLFMVGNSVESLPRNSQSEDLNGPKFSNAFHILIKADLINPGLYLALILNEFMDKSLSEQLLVGYLSRALRSFASFLREPDLAYKLKSELEKDCKVVEVNMDPDQDVKKHVDIEVLYKEHVFNIWSYQATKRGLPHTLDRLSGNRGPVCDGINILCPLKTEEGQLLIKKKVRLLKKREQIEDWKHKSTQNPTSSRLKQCNDNIQKYTEEYSDMKQELNDLYQQLSKELVIKHGWFLHSDEYIIQVKKIMNKCINGDENFIPYDHLQKIILGPEDFVKKINVFRKK